MKLQLFLAGDFSPNLFFWDAAASPENNSHHHKATTTELQTPQTPTPEWPESQQSNGVS